MFALLFSATPYGCAAPLLDTGSRPIQTSPVAHFHSRAGKLVITKLHGTSKVGMVVAVQREPGLPIKFVGLGEKPDDLQTFDAHQFARVLFDED